MIHIEYMPDHGDVKRFECRCGCIWRATASDYIRCSEYVTLDNGKDFERIYYFSKCPFCGRDVMSDD